MSVPDLSRYARQIALPEVGLAGQARLADARVLIVGARRDRVGHRQR